MVFTALLIAILAIPALIWLGIDALRRRRFGQPDRPDSTDGGSPTVFRRRQGAPGDDAEAPA